MEIIKDKENQITTNEKPRIYFFIDEDRVKDVIESILNTVDALLINNLWYHDFEAGKYRRKIENQ